MSAQVIKLPPARREFEAARVNMLTGDWPTYSPPIDVELSHGLSALRNRCRHEAKNNDAFKQFLRLITDNVIGSTGIGLQSQVVRRNGRTDERARTLVESEWRKWSKAGNCDVTGQLCLRALDTLTLTSTARDGEGLIRLVRGWDNRWRFALQAIDPDQLDVGYSEELGPDRAVVMGVEIDQWRRPIAYHLKRQPLLDRIGISRYRTERERVPARDVVHAYLPEWVFQTRGVPWAHSGVKTLQHLDGYVEAAVVAARKGAATSGRYTQSMEAEPTTGADGQPRAGAIGDGVVTDAAGNSYDLHQTMEPGMNEILPPGWGYQMDDPAFPNVDHSPFVKAMLQWFASGTGVGYNDLANDWEGVSYNSLRASAQTTRDHYKSLQAWYVEHVRERIFAAWLETSVHAGALPAPASIRDEDYMDYLAPVRWQCRRWDWVDPAKEGDAASTAISENLRSASSYIRERGDDPDEVFKEIAAERASWDELGIARPTTPPPAAPPAPTQDPDDA